MLKGFEILELEIRIFLTYFFFLRKENQMFPYRNTAYDLYKLKDKVKMLDKY